MLADTLVRDLAPVAFPPIIHRPRRERLLVRLRARDLRLIGPNFNVRAKPRTLAQALQLPDFRRLPGGYDEAEIFVETPTHVSPFDRERRADLIRRAIKTFLRMQQYLHFENHVEEIGTAQSTPAPEPAGTPATPSSR